MFAKPALVITLRFDELPVQPVNGLSFSGVTFGFTWTDSLRTMLGTLMVVEGESAQGCSLMFKTRPWNAAGILTLSFAAPSPVLQFGIARDIIGSLSPGFAVGLFKMLFARTFPVNNESSWFQ